MCLLKLPAEVQSAILADLDTPSWNDYQERYTVQTDDLRNMRLVSRVLLPAATRQLFRTLRLLPSLESIKKMDSILAHAELRVLVHELMIETFPEPNWTSNFYQRNTNFECFEAPNEWKQSLSRLSEFHFVTSVFLRFSADCSTQPEWETHRYGWDPPETVEIRLDILERVFKALADINAREGRRVRRLSIKSLQNVVQDGLVTWDYFRAVVSQLEELHISVATEWDESGEGYGVYKPEVHDFWPAFSEKWLASAAPQLTALTLYCNDFWGTIPKWDLDELYFPHLRSLALGRFTISYDWQIDWILKHKTLESLWLEDCPVVPCYNYLARELHFGTGRLVSLVVGTQRGRPKLDRMETSMRWYTIFERLRDGLPNLADFRLIPCTLNHVSTLSYPLHHGILIAKGMNYRASRSKHATLGAPVSRKIATRSSRPHTAPVSGKSRHHCGARI